jgi:hypothetical protein
VDELWTTMRKPGEGALWVLFRMVVWVLLAKTMVTADDMMLSEDV